MNGSHAVPRQQRSGGAGRYAARALRARVSRTWDAAEGSGRLTGISWLLVAGMAAGLGWAGASHVMRSEEDQWHALIFTFACLAALVALEIAREAVRRLVRKKFREDGGKLRATGRRSAPGEQGIIAAAAQAQIDALDARLCQVEELQRAILPEHEAMAAVIRDVHEVEGLPVPPDLLVTKPTLEMPALRLAWDAQRAEGA